MTTPWVLLSDGGTGGSRDCLVAARGLAAGGYRVAVTVSHPTKLHPPSRHCVRRIEVPAAWEPGFAQAVGRELEVGDYVAVVPASEEALVALGLGHPRLAGKGALEAAAHEAGISTPESRSFASSEGVRAAASELSYPCVVKPDARRYHAFRADDPEALIRRLPDDGAVVIQPYLSSGLRAVAGVMWRGRLVAAAHERWLRIWPLDCGLASAAVTVAPDRDLEARLEALMEGYQGLFCAQLAGEDLFDLNLRIHSSHSLAVAAGANLVAHYCDLMRGAEAAEVRARPGYFYRWLEADVRHIAGALRAGRMSAWAALRELAPRFGAAHSTESLTDPGPLAARLVYSIGRAGVSAEERASESRTRPLPSAEVIEDA
jgi:hypothetical protein